MNNKLLVSKEKFEERKLKFKEDEEEKMSAVKIYGDTNKKIKVEILCKLIK